MSRLQSALRTILLEDPTAIETLPGACAARVDALLEANRLEALVYKCLKDVGDEDRVSPERLAAWKMAYALSVGRALAYADALREILAIAAAHCIAVRLLRGTQLAFFVYPSPELRPLVDLEIQTPPECAAELHFALRTRRFLELESLHEDGEAGPQRLPLLAREGVTVSVYRRSTRSMTQAPWDPFSDSARNLSRPRILRPEALVVLLAHDLAAMRFCHALGTLNDLHWIVSRLRPSWDQVHRVALDADLAVETGLALRLLRELLGSSVEEEVASDLLERAGAGRSRTELLAKLGRTAATLYPAPWRLAAFVERLLSEIRGVPTEAATRKPPPAWTAGTAS